MNDAGVMTKAGKEWTPSTVRTVLTNPWYIGQYVYNVHSDGKGAEKRSESDWITIENHHPPILDEQIFYRLKFLLQRNVRGSVSNGQTYVRKNVHIFGGLLRCAKCGSIIISSQDQRRANGIRPSIYACGSRRRKQTSCTNKYISDMVLGPFVLNYVANIIRAAKRYDGNGSIEALSLRLLRGKDFAEVESVNEEALSATLAAFSRADEASEYRPLLALSGSDNTITEADTLKSKRRRLENALARLNTLYLYNDEAIPEKEFIIQRTDITKQLDQVNTRLGELHAHDQNLLITGSNLVMKASYYMTCEELIQDSYINYEKYVHAIDPAVPKSFLSSIIDHIDVDDGRVTAIAFKNGITHKFTYKS